jgi:CheY-like chemotaxis protein
MLEAEGAAKEILLIEDNREDAVVVQHLLRQVTTGPITHCADGESALDYLYRRRVTEEVRPASRPALILLDLNLPATDGREVLRQIKQDVQLQTIPVVVLTTSSNPHDVYLCYQHGANSYVVKPVDFQRLTRILQLLVAYWFDVVTLANGSL